MPPPLPDRREILARLVAFPTVSAASNLGLIDWAATLLAAYGIATTRVPDATGLKAGLVATVGPAGRPGVVLSAHTDVVPVDGQRWTGDPFALTERDGRLYGRGTTDMKGFLASALHAALRAAATQLASPLHLALSWDEEIGCVGARTLLPAVAALPVRPAFCIVGEPTRMAVVTGHKGKTAARAICTGRDGHSALAPQALNAIHLACDFVAALRVRQAEIAADGRRDPGYAVPYTTLHAGRIDGGVALNIVPNRCTVDFEIRNLAADNPAEILAGLRADAGRIAAAERERFPEAAIEIDVTNAYPGLDTDPASEAVALVRALAGTGTGKVAYGTEAGLFVEMLGVPTVVCGPGDMAQGHRPDEFVSEAELAACDAMLDRLLARLAAGL
jgi:acetylornithine deacetylase